MMKRRRAVFSIKGDRTPGADGMTEIFFIIYTGLS